MSHKLKAFERKPVPVDCDSESCCAVKSSITYSANSFRELQIEGLSDCVGLSGATVTSLIGVFAPNEALFVRKE